MEMMRGRDDHQVGSGAVERDAEVWVDIQPGLGLVAAAPDQPHDFHSGCPPQKRQVAPPHDRTIPQDKDAGHSASLLRRNLPNYLLPGIPYFTRNSSRRVFCSSRFFAPQVVDSWTN